MESLKALADAWKAEAATLVRRYGDERTAHVCRLHAAELEEAIRAAEDETLTLTQAARESGYSSDHLRHLVADGTIPNAGEKGRPRIRRGDLPLKPGADTDAEQDEARREARDILRSVRGGA